MTETQRLAQLEPWLLSIFKHPDGSASAQNPEVQALRPDGVKTIADAITPSSMLSATERVDVYANMYFWRLIEVLENDFGVLSQTLGHESFHSLARRFLIAHPSRSYTLTRLGVPFSDFIRNDEQLEDRAFLSELAALEWALAEAFHSEASEAIAIDDLLSVPTDQWAEARFKVVESLRLFSFDYPTNAYLQAHYDDRDPELPLPRPSAVAVLRRDFRVWRYDLSSTQRALLERLAHGDPLGEALMTVASQPEVNPEEMISSLHAWFRTWVGDGFFTAIELNTEPQGGHGCCACGH